MSNLKITGLVLRWIMEAGVVLGLAYWGFRFGQTTAMKILFAIAAPAIGFGFWGFVDFRWTGRAAEAIRLIQELLVSAIAAYALYAAGQHLLGWLLAAVSAVDHALVYIVGDRLLKER